MNVFAPLADWSSFDTWIVVTAALAAMACALPGNYLVLRRQSMMGDALSHTVLPGIAIAIFAAHWLLTAGIVSSETYQATWRTAVFIGAIAIGILTAVLTEAVQKLGRVENSASLGVVFTTLFALGLVLIRLFADRVHLDPDCVLYGTIETVTLQTIGDSGIPRAAAINGGMLLVNLLLVAIFFKELRISAFDPSLATTLGINATLMNYGLMAVTAATLVAAFESVGSILVIAMLIVPAATAGLLTNRLNWTIALSLAIAAASGVLGHVLALTLPPAIFGPLGFDTIKDASTAGMMAVAGGLLFGIALVFGPRHGLVPRLVRHGLLGLKIAGEDVLGLVYRLEEHKLAGDEQTIGRLLREARGLGRIVQGLAVWLLLRQGRLIAEQGGYRLTEAGRRIAQNLVRTHRLWEAYLAQHFEISDRRLHESAHQLEHYIDPDLSEELASELGAPDLDPHGRAIPPGVGR